MFTGFASAIKDVWGDFGRTHSFLKNIGLKIAPELIASSCLIPMNGSFFSLRTKKKSLKKFRNLLEHSVQRTDWSEMPRYSLVKSVSTCHLLCILKMLFMLTLVVSLLFSFGIFNY